MVTRRGALALILTILLVAACAGGDSEGGDTTVGGTTDGATTTAGETTETTEATGTTAGGEELPTLHIGIPLPFTGVVAESAEEMRQGLGVPFSEMMFVGDNLYVDVLGGQRCGMRAVHFDPPVRGTAMLTVTELPCEPAGQVPIGAFSA